VTEPFLTSVFEQSELHSGFAPATSAECDRFDATVQISPIKSVKRRCKERYGLVTESIYAPARSRIEVRYKAAAHPWLSGRNGGHH
jgi:hypothetical protein